jgi:hypothetical protein
VAAHDAIGALWEEVGREGADALDGASAVVVVSADPEAAAHAALGLGRAQSRRRRVAIADLVGDVEPLRALVPDDDAHGIVDSFHYGVSLNRIARQIDSIGNLFVMPSGTEPLEHGELLRHERWRRLTSGFREVEALLLLVAPLDAEGLDALIEVTDGVVTVGPVADHLPAGAAVLAQLGAPHETMPAIAPSALPEEAMSEPAAEPAPGRPSLEALRERIGQAAPAPRARPRWLAPAAALLLLLLVAGAAGVAYLRRDAAPAPLASAPRDSAPFEAPPPAPRDTAPVLEIANPDDSADVAPWAVMTGLHNTEAGATLRARDDFRELPLSTWTPVVPAGDTVRWYRVTVGLYPERAAADSLLRSMRARGLLGAAGGEVVRAPLSLVVQDSVPAAGAAAAVARWISRGVPAFAVVDEAGRARIYAGVFETADQASVLAMSLGGAGVAPVLAYRIGRMP